MDKNKIAVDLFNKYAESYQARFMDVSRYKESLDYFLDALPQMANVLDLACGPGNVARYLLDLKKDINLLGADLAPKMVALAQKHNPLARFKVMDCREVGSLNSSFDGVICSFILPYLSLEESIEFIKNAASVLVDNGMIYLSTMEDDYTSSGIRKGNQGDEIFMHFYTEKTLRSIFRENGIELVYLSRQRTLQTDGSEVVDLLIVGHKRS